MKTNLIGISGKIGSGKDTVGNIIQMLTQGIDSNTQIIEYVNGANITGFDYQIKKYADKLKDMVCLLIGCTREQLEDREFKEKELGEEWWYQEYINKLSGHYEMVTYKQEPPSYVYNDDSKGALIKLTPRKLLQLLGTECGRQIIHPNVWVNALFADYNQPIDETQKINKDKGYAYKGEISNWIITDVRFPNEAKAIKDRGGIVIRVNRPIDLRFPKLWKMFISTNPVFAGVGQFFSWMMGQDEEMKKLHRTLHHPSETALDDYDFDHVIDNNGSIEELVEKVKQLN